MWVCRNCDGVNDDDGQAACRTCGIDRKIVLDARSRDAAWICMSCGKKNPVRQTKCPICSTDRFLKGVDPSAGDPGAGAGLRAVGAPRRSPPGRSGLPFRKIALGGFLLLLAAGVAVLVAAGRYPSENEIRARFEATELSRINAGFIGTGADALAAAEASHQPEWDALSDMRKRMASDCGDAAPGAAYMEMVRTNTGSEYFKGNLVKLARAVDIYRNTRVGPAGKGYSLGRFRVVSRKRDRSGVKTVGTVEYEATLTALGDVTIYRPPYLVGEEHAPLADGDTIHWERFDRFHKAYLERGTEEARAAAARVDGKRAFTICPEGGSQVVTGTMRFEKTGDGWRPIAE